MVTVTSPILVGPKWRLQRLKIRNLLNAGTLLYRDTCSNTLNRGPVLANHPRELGLPANLGTQHLITPEAGPSGLPEQGASIGKPAEEDIKVQQLPTARTKLSGDARRKVRKAKDGQNGIGSLTQPGHETSPHQWVLNDPDRGVTLPQRNLPKNQRLLWSLGHIRKHSSTLGWLSS